MKSATLSRLRKRSGLNTQTVATYNEEKKKRKKPLQHKGPMGQLKPGVHSLQSLLEIFEFGKQLKLPLFKDSRSVFEKQGERVIKFRKIAQKRGMKNPEAAGERMYHKWRKKHGIKHDEGGFKSILGNVKK
jgi:hypothetical protein